MMSVPPAKTHTKDMPRARRKKKLHEFFSGIDTIENGKLNDERYGKFTCIDEPNMIVMTYAMLS